MIKENTLYQDVDKEKMTSHMVTKFDLPKDDTPTKSNHSEFNSILLTNSKRHDEEHFHHEKYLFNNVTNQVIHSKQKITCSKQ